MKMTWWEDGGKCRNRLLNVIFLENKNWRKKKCESKQNQVVDARKKSSGKNIKSRVAICKVYWARFVHISIHSQIFILKSASLQPHPKLKIRDASRFDFVFGWLEKFLQKPRRIHLLLWTLFNVELVCLKKKKRSKKIILVREEQTQQ